MPTTIGILQTGTAPDRLIKAHGDYPLLFQELLRRQRPDLRFRVYTVLDGVLPDDPSENDGWLITGSRHSVLERLPWMRRLSVFIRNTQKLGRPLVGICFGHQIIAVSLGGTVARAANGWTIGRQHYQFVESSRHCHSMALNAFHEDQVVSKPAAARVLARSDSCTFAMLEYGDSALSLQAHPEFSNAFVGDLITERLDGKIPQDIVSASLDSLVSEPNQHEAADMILDKLVR